MQLNVNTDRVVEFTNRLEKLHRKHLPAAIRGTLNKAALDVKKNTLLKSADKEFINRQPNFFRAFSRVEFAKGYDLQTMKATVGMTPQGLKGGNNFAVKDLEQQEHGGRIKGRAFIPMKPARVGRNNRKLVKSANRISAITNIVNARNVPGKHHRHQFMRAVHIAKVGGHVLGDIADKRILWRVNSLNRTRTGQLKLTALYSVEKGRAVKVHNRNFMEKASIKSAKKIEGIYIEGAERQIKIVMNGFY